ncbi:LysR family transcriptional regulator [Jiella sp. MQZ9-1]|uniref:LysR family transcriptional regulator n=1 Tax=Jiella flava TaxID=2816857 RepID=A0A939G285_9HYPH|nr:LysR substrate-binding domain-containing protein [Jiella flava]MBO0664555.1 LysR family transcriptional regulator [Jiella flava]MCD2473176.1 LysR family transcriptional regulator [Jiella flava]
MRLPPMNALKAFEAVSRHLSITKASQELNVSPGAISQQIKLLEDHFQKPLFIRGPRALSLTTDGAEFASVVQSALTRIAQASESLQSTKASRYLTISVTPSFGVRWLIPKLGNFHARHPKISVAVDAQSRLVDFAADKVDAAIRYGSGQYDGLQVSELHQAELVVVASPDYILRCGHFEGLDSIDGHRLIHYAPANEHLSQLHPGWPESLGLEPSTLEGRSVFYPEMHMVAAAAIYGQGLALMERILVEHDLRTGALALASNLRFESRGNYYFVTPRRAYKERELSIFERWLRETMTPDVAAVTIAPQAPLAQQASH